MRIGFCLLVPGARAELDVHAVPVYLVQKHCQQDGDKNDRAAGQQELLAAEQGASHNIKRVNVEYPSEEHPCHLPMLERSRAENTSTYHWNTPDNDASCHPINEYAQSVSQQIGANGDNSQPKYGEQQIDGVFLHVGHGPK